MQSQLILKRKSVRGFSNARFSEQVKQEIQDTMQKLTPLYPDIKTSFQFYPASLVANDIGGRLQKAPYYIAIISEEKEGYLENAGFIGEQLILHLTGMGIGTCWLGGAKARARADFNGVYCITIALGYPPQETKFRESLGEFKRVGMDELLLDGTANEELIPYIQMARLAPSGMNLQPVRYRVDGNTIRLYRKIPKIKIKIDSMQQIDTGIAAAHIFWLAKEQGREVSFQKEIDAPDADKMIYMVSAVFA